MDDQRFDRFARSLAPGLSRRQVARGLVGGLAALGWRGVSAQPDPEDTDPSCQGKRAINNNRCPRGNRTQCTNNPNCFCVETVRGNKRCVRIRNYPPNCPDRDQCDTNRQCGAGQICARVGGCCGGRKRNRCLELCG